MELPIISKTLYDNKLKKYKKYYKCNKCEYTCSTLWNLKKHTVDEHISIADKNKLPFYCKLCDIVCISQLYYDIHVNSNQHIEKSIDINIKKYIDERVEKRIEERIEELKRQLSK